MESINLNMSVDFGGLREVELKTAGESKDIC